MALLPFPAKEIGLYHASTVIASLGLRAGAFGTSI